MGIYKIILKLFNLKIILNYILDILILLILNKFFYNANKLYIIEMNSIKYYHNL